MLVFNGPLCIVTLVVFCVTILKVECREPCLNDQSLISKLSQRVQNTAPGYSIEDDCRMYISHPSALGGGHDAVYVDTNGHIEEAGDSHEKAFAKDITGHLPIDGLPVRFHTDETSYTNDLYSHGPNDGRVLEHHEIFNDLIPKGDNLAYASTPKELAESDADLHLSHIDGEADVRMHDHTDENGFQSHHNERLTNRQWGDHDGGHHLYYNYDYHTPHGDEHGGGHHGGGHHDDDHHGGGHHEEGHHEEGHHEEGHHEEGHHGEHSESHHGGEHGEHHGGHGEDHHGEGHHEESHHDEGHHHFSKEDHAETESSGDGNDSKKKPKKQTNKGKEIGSYTQDGKTHKVEFSEEEVNPYHGNNKDSEHEEKESKNDKDEKTVKSNNKDKSENFVFVLGGKSNKKFNHSNLPQVFKQLVNDAKILTSKYHGEDELNDGAGSGETEKETKMKNILKLPRFHSENLKESEENVSDSKEKNTTNSRIFGMLKNYFKSKNKKLFPGSDDNSKSMTPGRKLKKFNDYELGDLGATANKQRDPDKQDVDRIAQNIINKFTTKSGDLHIPNDVVKNSDDKLQEQGVQKEQQGRCCLLTTPPTPQPMTTPPPQIVVELPQIQLYPPTSAPPSEPVADAKPIGKQQRLQKLMRQKERLDRLESEYESELSSFKEELKKKDVPGKDKKEESPDLFLPKEMNGCKDSPTFEKLKECIQEAKNLLSKTKGNEKEKEQEAIKEASQLLNKQKETEDEEKEKTTVKPSGTATKPVAYKSCDKQQTTESSNCVDIKKQDELKEKLDDKKKVEQDSDSQSVDILGNDKKINEDRKEKEKKKEDNVFKDDNDSGGVPEPVQLKSSGKNENDDNKKDESEDKKKEEKDQEQKNDNKDEEKKKEPKEPFQLPPDDTDKDQSAKSKNDDERKPNPSKVKENSDDHDPKRADDNVPTPKNEKDKEEIVKEITKLQKALSTYYKTTKSSKIVESTPIVLVHEIRLVKDDKKKEAEKLNNNIKNLQDLLKENPNSKGGSKKCGSFFMKGQLVIDKECDEKRRSKIRHKHKQILGL